MILQHLLDRIIRHMTKCLRVNGIRVEITMIRHDHRQTRTAGTSYRTVAKILGITRENLSRDQHQLTI